MQTKSDFLADFRQILSHHLTDPQLNGARLADLMNMSRMHLHRHLKRYFGQSAGEVIRAERIRVGASLLRDKNLSIREVASMAGFRDPHYFARVFRKEKGFSPREFRDREEE